MQIFDSEMLPRKIPVSPSLCAVKVKPLRRFAKNLLARSGVGNGVDQPVDRCLIAELDFVSDKRAVVRRDQA
jgi:hypothetical protein